MVTEDQTAVVDFLASSGTHGGARVERIDTHASIVFLAGARAFKLKRAVEYDYLDFSTVERRRQCCEAELRLNRRAAPTLYRGIVAVTRAADGSLSLGGRGTPVDWLVEMNRFDQDNLFDRLAARGALDLSLMRPLAAAIAEFHAAAPPRPGHGGVAGLKWVVEGNAAGFAEFGANVLDFAACFRVTDQALVAIDRHANLLELRRAGGLVRECHGDLHLRNIVLLDGRPTLFDAVEFNDDINCTDVLYDVAFLLMDLWKRGLREHANVVWNGYLFETGDHTGLRLLPLFLSCRAAIRAKTSATAARMQPDPQRRTELEQLSREYLAMAGDLLSPGLPALVAIGGFSGSGKSTLAHSLAPAIGPVPGAIVIRSDEVRKRLFGVSPLVHLGSEAYTSEVSRRVYGAVAQQAAAVIRAGHAAVVDAVYARPLDRDEIEQTAAAAGVPFIGLWLEAPESVLLERIHERTRDASDATPEVVRLQLTQETGTIAWRRLDASAPIDIVSREALRSVQHALGDEGTGAGGLDPHDHGRNAA
jgi:aminoglycoside phosphotransferase family enzyme/predicted kinase